MEAEQVFLLKVFIVVAMAVPGAEPMVETVEVWEKIILYRVLVEPKTMVMRSVEGHPLEGIMQDRVAVAGTEENLGITDLAVVVAPDM